jgi:hypothetical protein
MGATHGDRLCIIDDWSAVDCRYFRGRVPGDPGDAPVPTPGIIRLLLEAIFFISATLFLAAIFVVLNVLQYAASYDRIL